MGTVVVGVGLWGQPGGNAGHRGASVRAGVCDAGLEGVGKPGSRKRKVCVCVCVISFSNFSHLGGCVYIVIYHYGLNLYL